LLIEKKVVPLQPKGCETANARPLDLWSLATEGTQELMQETFRLLTPHEIDEDLYTKPPKDDVERTERIEHPRKLRTRLMFCDLLED